MAIPGVDKIGLSMSGSDVEPDRLESILGGFMMWRESPLIGAGLGAYIHDHVVRTDIPPVIHNSALWIAAELGVVGLCAYAFLFLLILIAAIKFLRDELIDSQVVVLGCLIAFGVMSLVHDMLYQRLLWIVIGAAIAAPCSMPHAVHRSSSADS